jgi:hypothetical protein
LPFKIILKEYEQRHLPARFVFGEELGRCSPAGFFLEVNVSQLLPISVTNYEDSVVEFFDGPRWWEAAFCHGVLSHCYAPSALPLGIAGTMACTFSHTLSTTSRSAF